MTTEERYIGTGELCLRIGCLYWHLVQLWARGLVPPPQRIAGRRAIALADIPAIEQALREAGYLKKVAATEIRS